MDSARKREIASQTIGVLPGGPVSGAVSTAMSVEAALTIAQLEPEISRLKNRITVLEQDICSQRRDQSRFEANLSNRSREADQLACII